MLDLSVGKSWHLLRPPVGAPANQLDGDVDAAGGYVIVVSHLMPNCSRQSNRIQFDAMRSESKVLRASVARRQVSTCHAFPIPIPVPDRASSESPSPFRVRFSFAFPFASFRMHLCTFFCNNLIFKQSQYLPRLCRCCVVVNGIIIIIMSPLYGCGYLPQVACEVLYLVFIVSTLRTLSPNKGNGKRRHRLPIGDVDDVCYLCPAALGGGVTFGQFV